MASWFGDFQKNLVAAAEKASEFAQQASAQALVLAEQASAQAKILALQASEEAKAKYKELNAMAQSAPGGAPAPNDDPEELLRYGITPDLIDYVGNMTYSTFSDYPLDTLPSVNPLGADAVTHDPDNFKLSPWQARHCVLVLMRVNQLQHLRFALCPKRLSEQEFWTVYFTMTKKTLPPEAFGLAPAPGSIGEADAASAAAAAEAESAAAKASASSAATAAGLENDAPTTATASKRGASSSGSQPHSGDWPKAGDHTDLAAALSESGVSDGDDDNDDDDGDDKYDDIDDVDLDDADLDKLNDLENDPELAAYLKEALDVDNDDDEGGMSDLGSGLDDLDDYIHQLDEELGSMEPSPARAPRDA